MENTIDKVNKQMFEIIEFLHNGKEDDKKVEQIKQIKTYIKDKYNKIKQQESKIIHLAKSDVQPIQEWKVVLESLDKLIVFVELKDIIYDCRKYMLWLPSMFIDKFQKLIEEIDDKLFHTQIKIQASLHFITYKCVLIIDEIEGTLRAYDFELFVKGNKYSDEELILQQVREENNKRDQEMVKMINSKLGPMQREIEKLENQLKRTNGNIEIENEEIDDSYDEKIDQKENDYQNEQMNEEQRKIEEQLNNLNHKIEELNHQVNELKNENTQLMRKNENLRANKQEINQELKDERKQNKDLKEEIRDLQNKYEILEKDHEQLINEMNQLKNENEQYTIQLNELEEIKHQNEEMKQTIQQQNQNFLKPNNQFFMKFKEFCGIEIIPIKIPITTIRYGGNISITINSLEYTITIPPDCEENTLFQINQQQIICIEYDQNEMVWIENNNIHKVFNYSKQLELQQIQPLYIDDSLLPFNITLQNNIYQINDYGILDHQTNQRGSYFIHIQMIDE